MNSPIIHEPSNDKFNEIAEELKKLYTKIHVLERAIQGYCDHPEFRRNENMPYKDNDDIRVSYQCLKCGKYFDFNERQESFDGRSKHCENFFGIKFDDKYVDDFNLLHMKS